MASPTEPAHSVDEIIVAPEEAPHGPEPAGASEVFLALSQTLAREPSLALQRLTDSAMKLTGGDSAGVSLEDVVDGAAVFRWIATAGEFSRYQLGTMPRGFSPCGTAVDRGKALMMREPARFFPYVAQLHAPIHRVLLVPFARGGRYVGTLWVISHSEQKSFSAEDLRVVQNLTTFASVILDAVLPRGRKRPAR